MLACGCGRRSPLRAESNPLFLVLFVSFFILRKKKRDTAIGVSLKDVMRILRVGVHSSRTFWPALSRTVNEQPVAADLCIEICLISCSLMPYVQQCSAVQCRLRFLFFSAKTASAPKDASTTGWLLLQLFATLSLSLNWYLQFGLLGSAVQASVRPDGGLVRR